MRHIQDRLKDTILIDGTGGDACFGFNTLLNANNWTRVFNTPYYMRNIFRRIYSISGAWKRNYSFVKYLGASAACCEQHIALSPLVLCPANGLFNETYLSEINITRNFLRNFNNLIQQNKWNMAFEAMATVGDITHTCSRMYSAKTYELFEGEMQVVYPYLWRDILIEQGNISWAVKMRNGVMKWPLKRLLEKYTTRDFIYRRKSAFLPPFERWLMNNEVYELLQENLMDNESMIGKVVCRKNLKRLIKQLPHLNNFSLSFCHFLWGSLFTELWLRRHFI